jgi:hypothetical protein
MESNPGFSQAKAWGYFEKNVFDPVGAREKQTDSRCQRQS